ncbi:kielin/chordin-like protein [Periplaneta americana]|uniref:kielin/chordin-like protein n=1 Tax=Periplaneta americana TaxID=6978 RepID=UPI0037E97A21
MLHSRVLLVLAVAVIAGATSNVCRPQDCVVPKHYTEIGCTPIHEDNSCCPTRFDCTSLSGRDAHKCYHNGVAYDVNTELAFDPTNACTVACRCTNITGRAQVICADVECPELFQGPLSDPNCFRQYKLDKCCSVNTHCNSNATEKQQTPKLFECQYDGNTYKEGQVIYPEDAPCKKCICQNGFNGTLDGPWCQEISCGIELHYSRQLSDGCTPIYYGTKGCCPIDWRCPAASDSFLPTTQASSKNSEFKCKFGDLKLNIGDKLSGISNKCVECSCIVPPMVSCTQKPHNECTE